MAPAMQRPLVLLAFSLISSMADPRTACQHASTRQRLNAMDAAATPQAVRRDPPLEIFASVDLTPQQIASIDAGRPVAKVLSWGGPSEVYLFGAVHVDAAPDRYLAIVRDVDRLKSTRGYLGAAELSDPAVIAELSALTVDSDDVKALKSCRDRACDVQLPTTTSIATFHDAATRADGADQVNQLARSMLLELVHAYRLGGNTALGEYRDKEDPARVADQFDAMIERTSALTNMLPELRRYLLNYPSAALPGAENFFYWEKVAFGLKPTIRLNHAVIYRGRTQDRAFAAVAIKQLYASHYFHTALDISVCVDDGAAEPVHDFYLITLKGSEQDGLTGVKGSILRNRVTDKTRSSLESALAAIKQSLEQPARR
jgi:hypothetical protein